METNAQNPESLVAASNGLKPYQTLDQNTGEVVSKYRYLSGHPKSYRFDAKDGQFNINGTDKDFKTTSARTAGEFAAKCLQYDYDRQAAFYLDAIGGKRFIFVGIQKVKPFGLFHLEATARPGFVEYGRKKYHALLRKWKEVHGEPA